MANALQVRMEETHKLFAGLRLRNFTLDQCAEILGRSKETLKEWQKEDWYRPALAQVSVELLGNPVEAFSPLFEKAMRVYQKVMDQDKKLGVAHKAAQDVFNRLYGKPVQRQQVHEVKDITMNVIVSGTKMEEWVDAEYRVIPGLQAQMD